ncbi:MAG: HAMP domain-containing protein, partial [bacterium]
MKRKIVLSLLALFFVFATGAATAIFYITNTTQNLNRLIQLHQIEHLRQNLIISIQTAQSDLYTLNTALGSKLDSIVSHMSTLKETAGECSGCHHSPALVERLTRVQSLILDYETSLSSYITALATTNRLEKIKFEAAATGNEILMMTEDMSIQASRKLESMTSAAMKKINSARTVLYITIFLTCIAGMIIAVHLKTSITTPIAKLVDATRAITSGDLGYTIPYTDKTEFGELASRFNTMSSALKSGYETLEKEIADRMRTEAALVKSEQFLSTVFNSILDPFCIIDSTFTIVKVNDAYAQLKNRRAEDLIGKTCFETLLNREIICDDCVVQRTFFLSEAASKRKLISSPDGTKTWIEIYTYPIMDQQGVVTHVIEYT